MSVPKLRFKEFDGNWSEISFQDLFIFKNGVNASKEQYGSGIKFINVLDIINNPNGITYNSIIGSVDITSKEIEKNLVKYGDVLFQRSSETREEVGQSNVYLGKDPVVFGGFVIRGSAQKEYDPIFMNGLLKTDSLRDQITQLSGGSTRFNIGQDSLNKVSAYLPLKEEQTKIASFLSAVDEKISQLTQKHELLSQYKQGMMQKLFSQQFRFKADDGGEFGEWEETYLHTFLCESLIKGSKGNKAKKLTVKLWGKGVIPKNEAFQGSENTQYYKRSAGQLIYGKLDFLNCAFGLIPEYLDGFESTIDAPAFDIDNKIVHPYFLINRFLQKDFYQKNGEEADGSRKAKRINQSVFLAMQIGLPSLEEQTKIANFLSAIDQKIEVVAQQIEQAKTWKKGLLQQMFV